MNRRKASVDRNVRQRTSSRRPSVSSLYSRPNMPQQKFKPEKSPSTQMLPTIEPQNLSKSVQVHKAVETCIPKTRFNSQDRCRELRSYSSPRLKYFPAEKIKKFESPPSTPMGAMITQQNPYEAGGFYIAGHSEQCNNNGQGDAATAAQTLHQHRPLQNVQNVGQQQVVPHQAIHQVPQLNPHSESMIPQQILASQSHRPFVPHGTDHSPQKALAGVQNPHSAYQNSLCAPQPGAHQAPNSAAPMMDQHRSKSEEPVNATEQPDYDKQPIGGRNIANYRQMMNKQLEPQSQTSVDPNMPNEHQQLRNHYASHGQFPQHPQQVYQQLQQNMQQQMQMQQRAMNYQMQMMGPRMDGQRPIYGVQQPGRYYSGQGMTSPQDATANQMRNTRQMHQRDLEYSMNPQNNWPRNNQLAEYSSIKAQLNPYNLQVVGNNPHQQPVYQQPVHQHPVHQHPMRQNPQLVRNPGQATPMAYHQPGFDQQMVPNQQTAPQPPAENTQVAQNDKKPLQFTVGMIRDQEKLLNTMKQQRVPLDIMRRQFDTLLNEQRKHLEYLDHIQRQDDEEPRRLPVNPRRRRNVDEKPEWMAHLTPSRTSYWEMERLREQQKKEQEAQQQQQQNTNEMANQQVPLQFQNQLWQPNWQQARVPQVYNNAYPHPYMISGTNSLNPGPNPSAMNYQHQQTAPQYQYPPQQYNQPPQQYNQPPQQYNQPPQQQYQGVPQQNQEQTMSSDEFSGYQEVRQPAEPSSLLKIRQYRDEIRPQKRNNGLQNPEIARRQLEEMRLNAEARKGLEYLANFAPRSPVLKLNGIQDRSETETEIQKRLLALNSEPVPKRVSANGLENTRNPDNPPPQRLSNRKRLEQEFTKEYPRQRDSAPRNCYNVQAERENGTVANEQPRYLQQQLPVQNSMDLIPYNEKNPMMARGSVQPFRFDGNYPQHYQQMQQYYQNTRNLFKNNGEGDTGSAQRVEANKSNFERAGGDAYENMNGQMTEGKVHFQGTPMGQFELDETRTIGGLRYLARKQDYLPNQPIMAPDTLMASRHLQPPVIY